jgi:hypothetical protein
MDSSSILSQHKLPGEYSINPVQPFVVRGSSREVMPALPYQTAFFSFSLLAHSEESAWSYELRDALL